MSIPTLLIEDIPRGLPRQPVPLRLAYFITGLTWPNFTFLRVVRQEGRYEYLAKIGDVPRLPLVGMLGAGREAPASRASSPTAAPEPPRSHPDCS